MHAQSPHIVGISGGSCAGKTWLADRLLAELGEHAARLSQDDFYFDQSHLSPARRARLNFDHPRAIDWERLEETLSQFAQGRAAAVPRYDFATHGRLHGDAVLKPAPILIVEGLWLFRRPALRKLFDLKIFIRSTPQLCTERRLRRDTAERGRTEDQVLEQLSRYTLPMSEQFVAPQERWADAVIDAPIKEADVLGLLKKIEASKNPLTVGI
jgi:uridine kinase